MKKRVNLINRVSALGLPFFLALGLITPAFSITANAEAAQVLESSATVADCVMSYYAMSGSAVANTEWINTLYDSLGSSFGTIGDFAENSLMTYVDGVWQPTETLTQNIQNTSAYTELGLDTVFNVSAEEVANGGGFVATTGAATLSGAVSCVATHGILPVLGGVTAAYWGGIALGTLIAHKIGLYGDDIYRGVPMTFDEILKSKVPNGNRFCWSIQEYAGGQIKSFYGYFGEQNIFQIKYASNKWYLVIAGSTNSGSYYYLNPGFTAESQSTSRTNYSGASNGIYVVGNASSENYTPQIVVADKTTADNMIAGYRNGTIDIPDMYKSPDLIGEAGNLKGQKQDGNITIPDMKPQIDPQTQSGKPLSLQDWLQFANGVQNNNNSTSPVPDNTSLFQDILDAIRSVVPNPGPTPDPTPDPNPGGETYPVPGPVPDPSPVPDPEYQPETKPQPQYTEKPTENETDITEGDPWTTPDLLDKFPFCIPRDVYRVFTKLDSGARAAPHIQWRFNPNNKIDYTFDIDFSEWDNVATLLRTLELLGFIVALAVATRKMILS